MMNKILLPTVLSMVISSLMIGCGGGGSSSTKNSVETTPLPTNPTTPTEPATPTEPTTPTEKEPAVVDKNTTVSKVKIGVIDSGVASGAENLTGKVSDVTKFTYDEKTGKVSVTSLNGQPDSVQDISSGKHGTFVATILAGNTTNGSTAGVASDVADIYAAQTTYTAAGDSYTTTTFEAIKYFNQNYGVNLFNISQGGYWELGNYDEVYTLAKDVVANGGLMVFSTGNLAKSQPSSESLMPAIETSLEKGWLAVAGLNEAHTDLYKDASDSNVGSNTCGNAARWCLSADYVNSPYANSAYDTGLYSFYGTSGAAPQVTGTAALVWANYSWMTADQVRQAILTTADYMDDGSQNNGLYNETYGWGYLNTDK